MARKTYVIDTNVLLHDPQAIEHFHGSDVVIPLVVLEELDKMKHYSDELGKNARQVIRFIDSCTKDSDLGEGITIEGDTALRIIVDSNGVDKKTFPLALDRNKNKVLMLALFLKEEKKEEVIVVSKDFVMRVKAKAIGIETQNYESQKEPYKNIYRGVTDHKLTTSEVEEFLKNGEMQPFKKEKERIANEFYHFTDDDDTSIVATYDHKAKVLVPAKNMAKDVWGIKPLNTEQHCAMDLLLNDSVQLITLIGKAGTGKTLLALACGMRKIFDESIYSRMLISRPIMPLGKDIGYLPGTKEEKLYHWMQPIFDNLKFLCEETSGGEDVGMETKKWILESNKIEMEAVTYIRGRSLSKMFIIIDEAQNLTPHEVKTIISRAGHGTKIILTGDPSQIDNPYLDTDSNALTYIVNRFKNHGIFGHVLLETTERSALSALAAELL